MCCVPTMYRFRVTTVHSDFLYRTVAAKIANSAESKSAEFLHNTDTVIRGKVVNYMYEEDKPLEKMQAFCTIQLFCEQ